MKIDLVATILIRAEVRSTESLKKYVLGTLRKDQRCRVIYMSMDEPFYYIEDKREDLQEVRKMINMKEISDLRCVYLSHEKLLLYHLFMGHDGIL